MQGRSKGNTHYVRVNIEERIVNCMVSAFYMYSISGFKRFKGTLSCL